MTEAFIVVWVFGVAYVTIVALTHGAALFMLPIFAVAAYSSWRGFRRVDDDPVSMRRSHRMEHRKSGDES